MGVYRLCWIAVCLGLVACAPGSPGAIMLESPVALQHEDTLDLCVAYGVNHEPQVANELLRRGALTPADLDEASRGAVHVGMSQCAAFASWGPPRRVNETTTASGLHAQYVYGGGNYLYLDGGQISAVQN